MTRGERAAFASAGRAMQGTSARHMRSSGSERLVVRTKETGPSSAGQPESSSARTGAGDPVGGSWTVRVL
jgi:hypothetical protein